MSHASLDTAREHVGYIKKVTVARLLKQSFSCMATCIIICWFPSLVTRLGIKSICRDLLFTSSLSPYKSSSETRRGEQRLLSHRYLPGYVATFEQY